MLDDNVCPCCVVPETTGTDTSDGAPDDDDDVTTAVAADVALAEPTEFDAPTFTRNVEPTSPATNT